MTAAIRFSHIDEYHDTVVRNARVNTKESAQPCPVCFIDVHPNNWQRHMDMYHPGVDLPFDYASLDIETRITLRQRAVEIKAIMKQTVQGIIDIGEKLSEGKSRLPHKSFLKWIKLEFGWTPRAAQRFMTAYDAFKSDKLDAFHIGSSALYLLAAPSTPEGARREAIALMEGGEHLTIEATKALIAEHKPTPAVQEMVEENGVIDPLTIPLLTRIEGTDSFEELQASGCLQPTGNEADTVSLTDPAVDLQAALYDKSREHKIIGAQASDKPYTPSAQAEPIYTFEIQRPGTNRFALILRAGEFASELEIELLQNMLQATVTRFQKKTKKLRKQAS